MMSFGVSRSFTFDNAKVRAQLRPAVAGLGSHAKDAAVTVPTNLTAAFPPTAVEEGAVLYSVPNRGAYVNFLNEANNVREWGYLGGAGGGGGGETLAQTLVLGKLTGPNEIVAETATGTDGGVSGADTAAVSAASLRTMFSGAISDATSGNVLVTTVGETANTTPAWIGTPTFAGASGYLLFGTGDKTVSGGATGDIFVATGSSSSGSTGNITCTTGGTDTGSGGILLQTGVVTAGDSGTVQLLSGGATATTGVVSISSGTSSGADSGNVRLSCGAANTTAERGHVEVDNTTFVTSSSIFPPMRTVLQSPVDTNANTTYTTLQTLSGVIVRSGMNQSRVDSLATAAAIVAQVCSPTLNMTFQLVIVNIDDASTVTLQPNAADVNSTTVGDMDVVAGASGTFWIQITGPNTGSENISVIRAA
jgi:hypothetical protein